MLKGATAKRFYYFLSSLFRGMSFLGLLIAYIVVKIVVRPQIDWLNALLLTLSILSLVTAIVNLVLCGMTASAYKDRLAIQIVCFLITLFTGGIASSTFTGVATFTKVDIEDVKSERIFNTKTFKNKDGKFDEKTER